MAPQRYYDPSTQGIIADLKDRRQKLRSRVLDWSHTIGAKGTVEWWEWLCFNSCRPLISLDAMTSELVEECNRFLDNHGVK